MFVVLHLLIVIFLCDDKYTFLSLKGRMIVNEIFLGFCFSFTGVYITITMGLSIHRIIKKIIKKSINNQP